MRAKTSGRNANRERADGRHTPPAEVRDVADAIIAALGDNLSALLWHGSWARGEQTPESDHDMIVVVKHVDEDVLNRLREVFAGRRAWSTYVKTIQELRQYPLTGRLQFHYGNVVLYGAIEAPLVTREGLIEDVRRAAVDIQHEARYRLVHGSDPGKTYEGIDPVYLRMRVARWLYYQAKLALLALKARELLRGNDYPLTRAELRERLTDENDLAILNTIERWPQLREGFQEDVTPLAIQLDAVMRGLVAEAPNGRVLSTVPSALFDPANPLTLQDCSVSPCATYAYFQGTSMAGPHVAGVAALIFSQNEDMDPEEVAEVMMDTADEVPCPPNPFNPGPPFIFEAHCEGTAENNGFFGHGQVNAFAAISDGDGGDEDEGDHDEGSGDGDDNSDGDRPRGRGRNED